MEAYCICFFHHRESADVLLIQESFKRGTNTRYLTIQFEGCSNEEVSSKEVRRLVGMMDQNRVKVNKLDSLAEET
jgi:hypothetical protein